MKWPEPVILFWPSLVVAVIAATLISSLVHSLLGAPVFVAWAYSCVAYHNFYVDVIEEENL